MSLVTTTYQRRTGLVWRWFRGSVIVLGDGDQCQTLEGAAALVWVLLDEAMSETEITEAAVRSGTATTVGTADLGRFVHDAVEALAAATLITPSLVDR